MEARTATKPRPRSPATEPRPQATSWEHSDSRSGEDKADREILDKRAVNLSPLILIYLAFKTEVGGGKWLKLKGHTQSHSHPYRQRLICPRNTITDSLPHNHLHKITHM